MRWIWSGVFLVGAGVCALGFVYGPHSFGLAVYLVLTAATGFVAFTEWREWWQFYRKVRPATKEEFLEMLRMIYRPRIR